MKNQLVAALASMAVGVAAIHATPAFGQSAAWTSAVDSALGRTGLMQADGDYKFSFPRSDLRVTVGDVVLKAPLALGSWVAFLPIAAGEAMVMGDLVLIESEIVPVMDALQKGGVDQTALHNHLQGESPHVMYMHIMAAGNPTRIARTIRSALALTETPLGPSPGPSAPSAQLQLDTAVIARALHHSGKINGGVYQVSVPRREIVTVRGKTIPPSMGLATAINIQPTGGAQAVATGDFVLLAAEINPVLRALRAGKIKVTALHSHMMDESPRLFFMHFWGEGSGAEIGEGLGAALELTNSRK